MVETLPRLTSGFNTLHPGVLGPLYESKKPASYDSLFHRAMRRLLPRYTIRYLPEFSSPYAPALLVQEIMGYLARLEHSLALDFILTQSEYEIRHYLLGLYPGATPRPSDIPTCLPYLDQKAITFYGGDVLVGYTGPGDFSYLHALIDQIPGLLWRLINNQSSTTVEDETLRYMFARLASLTPSVDKDLANLVLFEHSELNLDQLASLLGSMARFADH